MSSYTRQQLENWLKKIDVKTDKVLDVGGAQNPIKGRTKNWNVKDYKILDLKQPHHSKTEIDFVWDINNWIENSGRENEIEDFDIVFCLEVSEYLWDTASAFNNLNWFLKKGGILYISFHFLYPHHNPEGKDYLRYTKWGVEKLLKETRFKIDEIIPRLAENIGPNALYIAEEMRPSKEYKGHDEVGYLVKAIKI